MSAATSQEIAEANRRRYEELRAAGQGATLKALPAPTARDGAPIAADAMIGREQVPPGWYATIRLRRGEALRIIDDRGVSSVALIGWRAEDMSERIRGAGRCVPDGIAGGGARVHVHGPAFCLKRDAHDEPRNI